LHSPAPLAPTAKLQDATVPAVCLLDALELQGFSFVRHAVTHTPASTLMADVRKAAARRPYFQCLLARADLYKAGVEGLPSTRSNGFYAVLLRTKKVPPKLPAKEYARMLAKMTDGKALEALDRSAPPAPSRRPRAAEVRDGDSDIVGDAEPIGDPKDVQPEPEAIVSEGEEDPPPEPEQDAVVGDAAAAAAPTEEEFPDIDGVPVMLIKGRVSGGWSYHERLKVVCPRHDRCSKTRSRMMDVAEFGPLAAELFLGAWLGKAMHMEAAEHKKYTPSRDDVRAYMNLR